MKLKARFNTDFILSGDIIYSSEFIALVRKYKDTVIEVEEEVYGGYELELEGGFYALDDEELIFLSNE